MHELLLAGNIRRSCFYNTGSFARYIWTWASCLGCAVNYLILLVYWLPPLFSLTIAVGPFWEDWIYVSCKVTPRLSVESTNGFGNAVTRQCYSSLVFFFPFMNWRLFLSLYSLPLHIWNMQMKPRSSAQRVSIKLVFSRSRLLLFIRGGGIWAGKGNPDRRIGAGQLWHAAQLLQRAPSVSTETGSR